LALEFAAVDDGSGFESGENRSFVLGDFEGFSNDWVDDQGGVDSFE